ncbi:hypothetical protein [Planococcus maritimus]|uniref:hypothetical protein n=1 Tax=Planococcus maritimus TaxID=192421 RepID=UPI00232B7791|nr:hypothetical protein [Planococcus maritimus]
MTSYRFFTIAILIVGSLWLVNDFFPNLLGISSWLLLASLVVLFITLFITSPDDEQPRKRGKHSKLIFTALGMGCPIALIALLTFLGGESSLGLALDSSTLWILVAVSLWLSYSDDKKAYKETTEEAEQ